MVGTDKDVVAEDEVKGMGHYTGYISKTFQTIDSDSEALKKISDYLSVTSFKDLEMNNSHKIGLSFNKE